VKTVDSLTSYGHTVIINEQTFVHLSTHRIIS
jgi:hypothetical protein